MQLRPATRTLITQAHAFRGVFIENASSQRAPIRAWAHVPTPPLGGHLDYNMIHVRDTFRFIKAYVGVRLALLNAGYVTIAIATRPHELLPCHPMDRPILGRIVYLI